MLIALSDEALDTLLSLAGPIEPALRDPFLRAVAAELGKHRPEEIGVGLVSRTARALQREFLRPRSGTGSVSKYN
jgi:hypothetical protein